ncbi:MAG: pyruvate ferredoxin oxidoreductase [Candidatus Krumholzibacteria bacterium]|nr:pyruvate ferredoxin oxidoreductase [Candidatus Krumholzibacteria bacterium]MDH4336896.1 pyruvate ferredoxin oxidoreductase [Candidatus Krumholzibacteria bacterium]MDH5269227.1 pyruvate ferredoxin oxidoreductase [Candidatus Krumholzibacteria bacterium]
MSMQLISANHASAEATILAARANRNGRGFCSGVYPITPQTECIERLCAATIEKGSVVRVESEHSAMGVCIGGALSGARTFTASSSNGLAYMAENVFAAGFFRLPIVMMAVNRTLGPPWNIWVDHGDTMMLRDAGWIQFYCEDNQEVFDTTLLAFRLAEDARVYLPVMVCQDAFVLSHTMMMTDIVEQEKVDEFLPTLDLPFRVEDKPRLVGGLDFPHQTEMHKQQHIEVMKQVHAAYADVQDEFERVFGRRPPDAIVPYQMDDADVVLVSMGTTASTVRAAVDDARARGIKAGGLRVRMHRPLPEDALTTALRGRTRVAVIDRNLSPGLGGILWGEIRSLADPQALIQNYLVGLGGGDIRPEHITWIINDVTTRETSGDPIFMEAGE